MAKLTYAEQLRHPKWQRRRLERLQASGWQCSRCGDAEKTLNVHHRLYIKGRMAWEYDDADLAVLCEPCHAKEHEQQADFETLMRAEFTEDIYGRDVAIGFLSGFMPCFSRGNEQVIAASRRGEGTPFFDIGVLVAALGPDDLKAALRRKYDEGRFPYGEALVNLLCDDGDGER